MSDNDLYRRAEKRADEKIGFYKHLYSFIGVNIMLFIINFVTKMMSGKGEWWFYWVTIFWGIGLVFHFLKTFVFSNKLEDNREQMIEKEMEKMKK
ncbi:2TM domain-containing protein [Methanobrevibacter sp.]|uniref:2TM domain-containing protein n=1 Tax=Methanobrevibacter sp. TaxID=66852 RepID=UPI0025E0AA68|nr:2TM domain-containing protein [Methanobrevibacter sp.]MBQ2832744.1 2TM domain-containing protein [Methanobrevibacter sp.]MBQ2832959.1 2TM domain-containing protein [Methanobrevibacter sp.]